MEPDTTIIARPTPAPVWLQPTVTEQLAGATAQAAQRTVDESHPAAAALAEPAGPANLNRLGDRIAELSSRIDAAIYELLCYLHQFNQQYGWEGFRAPTIGAPASTSAPPAMRWPLVDDCPTWLACGGLSYPRALHRGAASVACGATAAQVEPARAGGHAWPHAEHAGGRQRHASCARGSPLPVLLRAVEAALEQVPAETRRAPSPRLRRPDALGLVAESALAGARSGNPGDRFQVTVHVPADTLASREPASTPPLSAARQWPRRPPRRPRAERWLRCRGASGQGDGCRRHQ